MGHFESHINYETVSRGYKARSFNISILVICIADTVLSESETVFSRGFVTFFFLSYHPKKLQILPIYFPASYSESSILNTEL